MAVFAIIVWRNTLKASEFMGNAIGISNGAGIANAATSYGNIMPQKATALIQQAAAQQAAMNAQWAQYNPTLASAIGPPVYKSRKKFMIEGKEMDLVEFVETLYPDDCPERTYLLLKLKGD